MGSHSSFGCHIAVSDVAPGLCIRETSFRPVPMSWWLLMLSHDSSTGHSLPGACPLDPLVHMFNPSSGTYFLSQFWYTCFIWIVKVTGTGSRVAHSICQRQINGGPLEMCCPKGDSHSLPGASSLDPPHMFHLIIKVTLLSSTFFILTFISPISTQYTVIYRYSCLIPVVIHIFHLNCRKSEFH